MKIVVSSILVFFVCMTSVQAQCACSRPDNLTINKRTKAERLAKSELYAPKTPEEIVDAQLPSISESLELDPFEEAVVRTSLIKSVQKTKELEILQLEQSEKQEAVEKIYKQLNTDLREGLSKEKYDAFTSLQKKSSKKKKRT